MFTGMQTAQALIGCLKNRDNPHFNPFIASIDWDTLYMGHQIDQASVDQGGGGSIRLLDDIAKDFV